MTDIPATDNTVTFTFTECKDGENYYYPVVQINTRLWMAENLITTKYNDGTVIPNVTVDSTWSSLTTGAYCDYLNNPANSTTYGRLYNWYVAASTNSKNVCPTGWHVPSDAEWTTMETYLIANGYNYDGTTTGNKYAKSLAATTNWASSTNAGVPGNTNNKTGFTALPGSYRYNDNVLDAGGHGFWWSSTESSSATAWYRYLHDSDNYFYRFDNKKVYGFSIRCLRD